MDNRTDYEKVMGHLEQMRTKRYGWFELWNQIARYLAPDLQHLYVVQQPLDDVGLDNTGDILDNTASRALRTLGAGMLSGATSPARPWLAFKTDDDLMKSLNVRIWLHEVARRMLRIFSRSNVYRSLHENYQQMGGYGTGCSGMFMDYHDVLRLQTVPVGEFFFEVDARGRPITLYREFALNADQIVREYGLDNVPAEVKNQYDARNTETRFVVIHAIHKRTQNEMIEGSVLNTPYRSVTYVQGDSVDQKPLRDKGFRHFPGIIPRWDVLGNTPYGRSPGTMSLGDIKALQVSAFAKQRVIDYQSNPPIQVPTSFRNRELDVLPGGVSFVDALVPHGGIRTAFEVQLDLNAILADIQDTRERINSAFYVDLFMMFANQPIRSNVSVPEVNERAQEKLLVLGPVVERLNGETLAPLVEFAFDTMIEGNLIPPPPPEMHGREVHVEFVSAFAQAQKAVTVGAMDRFLYSLGTVGQAKPEVWDNVNADDLASYYSESLGVDPSVLVAGPQLVLIRKQRAQAQAQQVQAAAQAQEAAAQQSLAKARQLNAQAQADQPAPMQQFTGY